MESLNNENIHYAVNLWCNNVKDAILKYGHISNWNVSNVTNMHNLFQHKYNFNELKLIIKNTIKNNEYISQYI